MLLIFLILMLLASCTPQKPSVHQIYVFGTMVEINIWHDKPAEVQHTIDEINNEFKYIHQQWHAWKPGRLQQINQLLRSGNTVKLEPDEIIFIRRTINLAQQSNHRFNPAIGELINLWGFHSDEYPITTPPPSKPAINTLIDQQITVNDLVLNRATLSSKNLNIWLDFGGIAKGYAVDQAIEILQNNNIQNAIVNAGGDIRSLGHKPKQAWRVAIQSPKDWSMLAEVQMQEGEAIFTSGNYQRYKEFDGQRYAHIIDPGTGMPVKNIVAATVLANNGLLADAAATALVVAGDDWRQMAKQMNIKYALIIDENHRCRATKAMSERLENLTINCQAID
ncbi:FAD:protein FMN transferase [Marinicella sp. X102]|nr:FAD:protein FMN transferase [Marinicella marina]